VYFNICSTKNGQFNLHAKLRVVILNASGDNQFLTIQVLQTVAVVTIAVKNAVVDVADMPQQE